MDQTSDSDNKTQRARAAKRYIYPQSAVFEFEGEKIDVQMLNISTSGIQVASKVRVVTKNPVRLTWDDEKFGDFNITLLIAREIYRPENQEYQYYYGLQYCALTQDMKDRLLVLLRMFKETDKKNATQEVEKITSAYLSDVIGQGKEFLKNALIQGKTAHFDKLITEIKDYEKLAFNKSDQISICLQKVVTHNFHCNLLGMMTSFVVEKRNLLPDFLSHVRKKLEAITETENLLEGTVQKSLAEEYNDEKERKQVQKQINESSNRLFYTKQGLMHSVVENFDEMEFDVPEAKRDFEKIREIYEKIQEFTNQTVEEPRTSPGYSSRQRRPREYSKAEAIMDVPVKGGKKTNYSLYAGVVFIIIFLIWSGISKVVNVSSNMSLQEDIGFPVKVKKFVVDGNQINIVVSASAWENLSPETHEEAYNKVIKYLKAHRTLRSGVIYDDKERVLKIVFEGSHEK